MADTGSAKGTQPLIINPAAAFKSIQERFNALMGNLSATPEDYEALTRELTNYADNWIKQSDQMNSDPVLRDSYRNWATQAQQLSTQTTSTAQNVAVGQIASARSWITAVDNNQKADLEHELAVMVQSGTPITEAIRVMMSRGGYDVSYYQDILNRYDEPGGLGSRLAQAAAGTADTTAGDGFFPPGDGGGASSRFKPVANDTTNPQLEFQKGFSLFQNQLAAAGGPDGRQPNLRVMNDRYQELYQKYLGEIERRKLTGEEPANVFKEEYTNIGKNTDPQFNTEVDQFQLKTVLPTLSVSDYLAKSIDPQDLYQSTPPPGQRDNAGYRGFVRRINR